MEDMYNRFAVMSHDMDGMTKAVTAMEQHTQGIPVIAASMQNMNANVGQMQADVGRMSANVSQMDDNMTVINGGVLQMANRFEHLSATVHGMGYNVNQMSEPVRSTMPWMPR
jgi:methyl-accepting chemotaxis protein